MAIKSPLLVLNTSTAQLAMYHKLRKGGLAFPDAAYNPHYCCITCNMFAFSFAHALTSFLLSPQVYIRQMLAESLPMANSGSGCKHWHKESNKEAAHLVAAGWEPMVEGVWVGQQVCGGIC